MLSFQVCLQVNIHSTLYLRQDWINPGEEVEDVEMNLKAEQLPTTTSATKTDTTARKREACGWTTFTATWTNMGKTHGAVAGGGKQPISPLPPRFGFGRGSMSKHLQRPRTGLKGSSRQGETPLQRRRQTHSLHPERAEPQLKSLRKRVPPKGTHDSPSLSGFGLGQNISDHPSRCSILTRPASAEAVEPRPKQPQRRSL